MSYKEDMQAALECRQPETAVPIWKLHFHGWEQASGRRFISGKDFAALTTREQEQALEDDAEIIVEVASDLGFAGVTIPDPPWDCPYTLPREARLILARLIRERSSDVMVVAEGGGVIGMPGSSRGYVEFYYKVYDAPEEIDEMAQNALHTGLERVKAARDAGVEAVYCAADIADNHGPFLKPEHMGRFVLPYLRKWVERVKEMGLYTILHTDGNVHSLLADIVASGVHALQAIDPVAGMDIRQVKAEVGDRLCLCGNVDCGLLIVGPPEEVYESTRDLLQDCKQGGGFVLGASNGVVMETPIGHYYEMVRAWRDHGRYRT
jgi:uroporphyrinogen decarboxylase